VAEDRGGLSPAWRALIAFWLVLLTGGAALVAWLELTAPGETAVATAPARPSNGTEPAAAGATAASPPVPPTHTAAAPEPAGAAPADRLAGTTAAIGPGGIAEPDPALIETRPDGALPRVAPDGRQPWRVYARRFDDADRRPRIAVLVVGLGVSESATTTAIERLPGEISLAFSPYGLRLERQFAAARAAGHEVLIGLPMEPANFPLNDPGPQALLTGLPPPENAARLAWALSRAQGYVGVTNAASAVLRGERFTASAEAMRPVLETLRERGLLYIEARPGERAPSAVPARAADVVIDERPARAEIEARLAELERIALERGVALGVSGPSPLSLDRLAVWAPQVGNRGLVLAPVSAVVVRPATTARP
jgi:polysaccharide deacetylase 2 family uncharacterized protein YibQ